MGGAIAEGNVTPAAEFNIWDDPEAARRVFESGIELTMIGLDVTHKALMTRAHAERLRASGRVGTMVAELLRLLREVPPAPVRQRGLARPRRRRRRAPARPDARRDEALPRRVDTEGELCRGRTVVDLWRRTENEPNAHVGVDVDGDRFMELLLERVASLG